MAQGHQQRTETCRAPDPDQEAVQAEALGFESNAERAAAVLPPPPPGDPGEEDRDILERVRARLVNRGSTLVASDAPARYRQSVSDLEFALHTLGPERLAIFDCAIAGFEPATRSTTAEWVARHWRPAVQGRRRSLLDHVVALEVEELAMDRRAERAAGLPEQLEQLACVVRQADRVLTAHHMHTLAEVFTEGIPSVDPISGGAQTLADFGQAADWLGSTAAIMKLIAAGESYASMEVPENALDHVELAHHVLDGVFLTVDGLVKVLAQVYHHAALVTSDPVVAQHLRTTASQLDGLGALKTAGAVVAGIGLAVSAIRAVLTYLDEDATFEDKVDASINVLQSAAGVAVAAKDFSFGAAAIPVLVPVAVSATAGWWLFRSSLRQMASTTRDISNSAIIPNLQHLQADLPELDAIYEEVVTAQALAAVEQDEQRLAALQDVARARAGRLRSHFPSIQGSGNYQDFVLRELNRVGPLFASIQEPKDAERAMLALMERVEWLLANYEHAALVDAGYRTQESYEEAREADARRRDREAQEAWEAQFPPGTQLPTWD